VSDTPFGSALSLDTSTEADAVQLAAYRRLSGRERVAIVFRLNDMVRTLTMAGIRRRHPAYDDTEVRMAWQRLVLGDDLVRRVFPGRELIDP
jgi:hypothetical protein